MNHNPEVSFVPRERILLRWWLAAFVVLTLLVSGFYAAWQVGRRDHAVAQVVARLEILADARKNAVRTWIRERRADVEVLAWDPDMIGICLEGACPKGMDPTRLMSHLENHRFFPGFMGAYLFTPSGQALLAAEGGKSPCPESTVRARQAAREKRFVLHDLHREEDGTPEIGFLEPVFHRVDPQQRTEDAPVLGVVGIYLDPRATLFPVLAGVGHYAWSAETYLVRREGDGVRLLTDARGAPPAPDRDLLSLSGAGALEHSAAVDGERAGRFLDFRGTPVLAAVRWVSEAGWGLVAKVDEAEALATWRREMRTESVLLASGLLSLLLGGVATWRWWSGRRYRLLLEGLRDREERLRALAQGSEDVVFLKGIDGRYLLVNQVAADLLGTTPAAALGRRHRDFLAPGVSQALEAHDAEVLQTGVAFHGEEVIPQRGGPRTFLSSRVPIRDSRGDLQGVAGVLRDITERKRDEQALARWTQTLGALYRLARGLTAAAEVTAVHACLLDGAGEALAADLTALYLGDGEVKALRLAGGRHLPPEFAAQYACLPMDAGVARSLFAPGEVVAVSDGSAHSEAVARFAAAGAMISLLAVPLRGAAGATGLLVLGFVAPRALRPEEGEALALLGHMAGVAADRCRALAAVASEAEVRRRAEERLRQLHAATAGLTGQELFQRVADAVAVELAAQLVLVCKVAPGAVAVPLAAVHNGVSAQYAPYALAGTPCHQVVQRAALVSVENGLQQAFPNNPFLREHGFVSYAGVPLMDTEGRVAGVLCLFRDSPLRLDPGHRDLLELYALRLAGEMGRLLAEEQLSEARRALDTLIEKLPGAVYRSDWLPHRPLQFISAGSRVVSGYGSLELLGEAGIALGDLIVPEDRPRVWREIQVAVAEGRSYETEYRIHDREGVLRWVYDVGTAVWPAARADQPVALEGVLFDRSERHSLEAQLSYSQRMDALGRLAGGVAHDFNNLLTAISGYTELLVARLPDDPRAHQVAGEVLKSTDRAAELTRQLLAFGGRQVVEPRLVELDELVAGVGRMLERLVGEDIRCGWELKASGGLVRVDPGQVEQVLLSLVVNARDAMPGGGELTVGTRCRQLEGEETTLRDPAPPGAYVELAVTDTGVGMAPEVLERVFDPFFTTKEQGAASGLGLAAVYGAVRQAGGYVLVESTVGAGTTFRVLWPRSAAHAAAEPPAVPILVPAAAGGQRVLLVEDEAAVREVAGEHLLSLGYRVTAFASAVEAVAGLDALETIAAVVTDIVMPGMRGTELVRRVRGRWPGLPVVYISGHAGDTLGELEVGASRTAFLQKPFRLGALAQTLSGVLGG